MHKFLLNQHSVRGATIFSNLFIFNWRIISLQYSVGFCHTSAWISHSYTRTLSLEIPFHLLPHPTALGCHRALGLGSLSHTANSHWLPVLYMVIFMFQFYSVSSSHTFLPLLCPQVCSLSLHLHLLPCK